MDWTFASVAAAAVFAATYVLISLQKVRFLNLDRPSASMSGAVLMVLLGVMTLDHAFRSVSWDTILLLLGMMVLVAYLRLGGFFEWVSAWILLRARTPQRLLWLVIFSAGLLSALFVNDTICLLFTPVLLAAVRRAGLPAAPYLIALATSSNIGSAATLTGNPQNMLIGIASGLSFGRFALAMLPVAVAGLAIDGLVIGWLYRGRLGTRFITEGLSLPPVDRIVLRRVGLVFLLVLAGFLLPVGAWLPKVPGQGAPVGPGQTLPLVAMAGAVLAVLVGRIRPAQALARVDWSLLLFFACLFVVTEGVNRTGVLAAVHDASRPLFAGGPSSKAAALSGVSLVLSNVVSNVPFVLVAAKWIPGLGAPGLLWPVLAMSSTFAGNLTIVGSVANMIVMEQAKDDAPIGFLEFLRVGVPVTLLTTAAGLAMLLGGHALGLL